MNAVKWFYASCVASVVSIYVMTNTWPASVAIDGFADVVRYIGQHNDSLREWIGATSGWAAFLAGVITIIILMKQLNEQRRQTAFILGDEIPTLDSIQDAKDAEKIVLRIVNWNRRSFKPERINIPNTGLAISMHSIDINGAPVYKPAFYIEGWVDRSKAPKICTFELKVADKTPENTYKYLQNFSRETEIIVSGVLLGKRHRRTDLQCYLHP